jgi:hypothetical protein
MDPAAGAVHGLLCPGYKNKKAFNPNKGIEDFGVNSGALRCVA